MLVVKTVAELKNILSLQGKESKKLGFVPTMGALHPGHISLIARCRQENDVCVSSIFVNPTQFNDKKDLEKYPRTPQEDIKKLEKAGCDLLFTPATEEIYPNGLDERLSIDLGNLGKVMEGLYRPGHFSGVVKVVKRLFDIVQPHAAYFGKKDFQQVAIIKHMVKVLKMPLRIVECDTLREEDGLAMSSRNALLTKEERSRAPHIYKVLKEAREKSKIMDVIGVKKWVKENIALQNGLSLEYFEIVDRDTLMPVEDFSHSENVVGCIAVKLGKVRLIDNVVLKEKLEVSNQKPV